MPLFPLPLATGKNRTAPALHRSSLNMPAEPHCRLQECWWVSSIGSVSSLLYCMIALILVSSFCYFQLSRWAAWTAGRHMCPHHLRLGNHHGGSSSMQPD